MIIFSSNFLVDICFIVRIKLLIFAAFSVTAEHSLLHALGKKWRESPEQMVSQLQRHRQTHLHKTSGEFGLSNSPDLHVFGSVDRNQSNWREAT